MEKIAAMNIHRKLESNETFGAFLLLSTFSSYAEDFGILNCFFRN